MKTILIVDDEAKIRDVIASYLLQEGYRTVEAGSGAEALAFVRAEPIDLIILDLMMPGMTGEEVCGEIRRMSAVPILILTAKVSDNSRIQGLSIGADDYLTKPFNPREVVARVRAILRRSDSRELLADRIAFYGGELVIDAVKQTVTCREQIVNLTPNEYKLLLTLARHPLRTFSREELIAKVFGYDYEGDERTIDQHVKNLRQKIEADPKHPQTILTVFGMGYKFAGGDR